MNIEVYTPSIFQSNILNVLTKRKAQILNINVNGESTVIDAEAPLANMFGVMTEFRSVSQGQAEYSMEFKNHQPMLENERIEILEKNKVHFDKKKKNEI